MKVNDLFFLAIFIIVANLSVGQTIAIRTHEINEQGFATIDFEGLPGPKGYQIDLVLVNNSNKNFIINKVEGGCECVKVKIKKKKIKAHQTIKLLIKWGPNGDTEFSSSIMIHSNASNFPQLWLQLLGNVEKD